MHMMWNLPYPSVQKHGNLKYLCSFEMSFLHRNWTFLKQVKIKSEILKYSNCVFLKDDPQYIFLSVSKLFATFVRQIWKWSAKVQSRNQTFSFPICLHTAHWNQYLCTLDTYITSITASHRHGSRASPSHLIHSQGVSKKGHYPGPPHVPSEPQSGSWSIPVTEVLTTQENCSSWSGVCGPLNHYGMDCVIFLSSLQHNQMRILKGTFQLRPTGTPNC